MLLYRTIGEVAEEYLSACPNILGVIQQLRKRVELGRWSVNCLRLSMNDQSLFTTFVY